MEKEKSEKSICSGDIDHTETPRPWQSFHTVYTNAKAGNPLFHTQPIIIIAILHTIELKNNNFRLLNLLTIFKASLVTYLIILHR